MKDVVLRIEGLSKSFRIERRHAQSRFSELLESVGSKLISLPARLLNRDTHQVRLEAETFWALQDVSFEVTRGEFVGFVGRNGAGKSTLLKLLSRITHPTHGRMEIRGRVGSLLEVGTGFHPELSGRENIYLNGALLGMSRSEIHNKFDEIVAFSEVEQFLDTPVKRYSSGMYVRLAFAVAAHLEPEILIVDEVLAVGDTSFQQKCMDKMRAATLEGKTVLIVSHSLPIVTTLCHRAILLDSGKIVEIGSPIDIVKKYMSTVRSASGEVVWATPEGAPGTDVVRLHAVRVFQGRNDQATAEINAREDVVIRVSYWNLLEGQQLYAGIWLKDSNGTFVLATSNVKSVSATEDPWYGTPQPTGLYEATCVIPGNLLCERRYVITAIVGRIPNRAIIVEESILTFEVITPVPLIEENFGNMIGPVVHPHLNWTTTSKLTP